MLRTNLVDYTKFRLKPEEEIRSIFEEVNRIFILSCGKCYKKFEEDVEEEYDELSKILGEQAKKIVAHQKIDFLCNDFLSKKKLLNLDLFACDNIGVLSCGLGVQFVAGVLEERHVYTLADTSLRSKNPASEVGHHGISLEEEKCVGCGQCYLNLTGGICPSTNCPKGLLNGPCGGANNGKCEVDPNLDCAWVKIYERLKKQGRKLPLEVVPPRDYSKPLLKVTRELSLRNQALRSEGFYGGLYPLERKEQSEDKQIQNFPGPEMAIIFLSQHAGREAKPIVKPGDEVKIGQKIAEADGYISASIHSSISGKVVSIERRIHPVSQNEDFAIIIENDGESRLDASIQPLEDFESLSRESLLEVISEKGIVGLGGAMFPTHVKLSSPKPIDTLIVNGCECEPYLNSDNRMMIEHPDEISNGIRIVQKILEIDKVFIGVEDNKPEAIATLSNFSNRPGDVSIVSLKTKYPQGAEGLLIKKIAGREVPEGGLPLDIGVVVLNISTIFSIYQAVVEGIPLIQRVITMAGDNLKRPGNYLVKIGTPFKNLLQYCMDEKDERILEKYLLKMGGPMMGISQTSLDSAVVKGTTGLVLLFKALVELSEERDCIRCGRCVESCPMELHPLYYAFYGKKGMWERTKEYKVENCIECGCCEYICSSKISLLSLIKKEKQYARNSAKA